MVLKNLFTGQQWRNRLENKLMDMGTGEERVRCMERVTWKFTLSYIKYIANGDLLYGSGHSNRAVYQPRVVGWGGTFKREGIYVYLWLIHGEV